MTQTLFGSPLSQEWADIIIWEKFFNEFPVKSFIELGTGNGGMSIFFALQCYQRGIEFRTFDNQKWIDFDNGLPKLLHMEDSFFHVDIFGKGKHLVEGSIEVVRHPLCVMFDDGDKPREWREFAHLTQPGDFLVVHDWDREFFAKDIGDVPVERILVNECEARLQTGYKAMWFRRI